MDFIETTSVANSSLHAMLSFAIAGLAFIALALATRRGKRLFTRIFNLSAAAFGIFCALAAVGALVSTPIQEVYASRDATEKRIETVKDEYGITLTADQLRALDYPRERPGEGRYLYGETDTLIESDGELKTVTVRLAWDEDHFLLMDTRTTPGVPLPTK